MRARCADLEVSFHDLGRGEPLVLVHGLADDHRGWRRALPELALRHRVLLYDLRGHGETTLGQADGTLRQLGEDLRELLDALKIETAAVAGFSLGGTVAMRFALDHPERVRRLLLVATSSRVGRAAADWYRERIALAEQQRLAPALEEDTRQQFEAAPQHFAGHWLMRSQSTADPRGYANACRAMAALLEQPLDPELPRLKAPTLIVAAELDRQCPVRAAEIIQAGVLHARLEVIPACGHQIPVEQPERLSELMLA
ncbi:MAG TPA: alpha/beta fold hydrolase [Candidatus Acidoferrales bacterium]|nr:alpha/beta fold hydrolase [Candidatus Acidoferrales bacterium]